MNPQDSERKIIEDETEAGDVEINDIDDDDEDEDDDDDDVV